MVLDADGSGNEVDCGSGAAIDNIFTGGGTIMAWLFFASFGELDGGYIAVKGNGWHLQLNDFFAVEALSFVKDFSTTDARWDSPDNSLSINTWTHVAVTYDDGSTANDPIIYLDGQSVTVTEDATPVGTASGDAAADLLLFNRPAGDRDFDGSMDVRLFDRILTGPEVLSAYTQLGVDGIHSTGHWPMNEQGIDVLSTGAAGSMKDWSGNGNDGTVGSTGTFPHHDPGIGRFRRRTL